MEIIAAAFAVGLLGLIAERQDRAYLFPPQVCRSCIDEIHFDWKRRLWLHSDGAQYHPTPSLGIDHPALPHS